MTFPCIQGGFINCVCTHVRGHVRNVYARGGQRSIPRIFLNCFPPLLRQCLSQTWTSLIADQQHLMELPSLLSAGITDVLKHLALVWVPGTKFTYSHLCAKYFSNWTISLEPHFLYWRCTSGTFQNLPGTAGLFSRNPLRDEAQGSPNTHCPIHASANWSWNSFVTGIFKTSSKGECRLSSLIHNHLSHSVGLCVGISYCVIFSWGLFISLQTR